MFVKITAVEYKAEIALINACPVSICIFKLWFDFFCIGRLVCFQKSFLFRHNERIGAAAIPYTGLGIILFRADTAQGLPAAHTDKVHFNARIFFKFAGNHFRRLFYDSHVYGDFF